MLPTIIGKRNERFDVGLRSFEQGVRLNMIRIRFSNILLVLGIIMLSAFAVVELVGMQTDPLIPAFAAFFIGGTAVLDRLNPYEQLD
jgi:hypothetical protein